MTKGRLAVVLFIVLLIAAFFVFHLGQYFNLAYLKSQQAAFDSVYQANPLATGLIFFAVYVAVTALSLPGAAILTLAAGAVFGLWWGILIASFASSMGAVLALLVARFVLRDTIQKRFGDKLRIINAGVKKDGAFYLLTLRLLPVFPFFVVNLVMALTPMGVWTFYWVSQLGMFIGTVIYVNAGTQIAKIQSPGDVLSLSLLLSLCLLAVFPLATKQVVEFIRKRKHKLHTARAHAK
jgi:uncharacterized membrane protein YdjX (TVP38/TMEM64 family)